MNLKYISGHSNELSKFWSKFMFANWREKHQSSTINVSGASVKQIVRFLETLTQFLEETLVPALLSI